MSRIRLANFVVTAAVLSACGSPSDSHSSGMPHSSDMPTAAGTAMGTAANAADVMFAQMMVPHHEQAVAMADLAAANTTNEQVLALAASIKASQQLEIDMMRGWLAEWGAAGMEHTMGDDGMLTEDQMAALAAARGDDFDRLFLSGMIAHHRGAIAMAESVITNGQSPDVLELARQVIASQTAEVETMSKLVGG